VAIGFVETHGRADTAALIERLACAPPHRRVPRRSASRRLSLTTSSSRAPAVAIVDELAHTNVPAAATSKRYQDVLELLDAGINVIGALNVQHLESLNDVVERETGVAVRETVPDSFLKQADQVVNLDLAVEDLQERCAPARSTRPTRSPARWAAHSSRESRIWPTCASWPARGGPRSLERGQRLRPAVDDLPATAISSPPQPRECPCLFVVVAPGAAALLRQGRGCPALQPPTGSSLHIFIYIYYNPPHFSSRPEKAGVEPVGGGSGVLLVVMYPLIRSLGFLGFYEGGGSGFRGEGWSRR
jgi:hypothetical protein